MSPMMKTGRSASSLKRAGRRFSLCVEILEFRSLLSTAAQIQWSIAPNFAPDPNRGGQVDLPNTSAYVNPPNGYDVLLDASRSRGITPRSSFLWTITGSAGKTTIVEGEKPNLDLLEGSYSVLLEADNLKGAAKPAFASTTVLVKDILIVSIGDSVASGEGNPVVPGYFFFRAAQWAYSADPAMNLENANAHRSTLAGPAQFALAVQAGDPHVAVTFVSVANSGASIAQGVLSPMPSIGDPSYILPPEINELRQIIGTHPIDVMTVSIGANDIGFSTRVEQLITNTLFDTPSLNTIQTQVNAALSTLPQQYAQLGQAIQTFHPGKVLITEYPDLTRNNRGKIAPIVFSDVNIISKSNVRFALNNILNPLDAAVKTAAGANGWTYVGGLSSDFRTHGYPSTNSWFRDLNDSYEIEDSRDGAFHPNAAGHLAIARRLLAAYSPSTGFGASRRYLNGTKHRASA